MATNVHNFQLQVGEQILCYYGLLIYEAKCTGLSYTDDGKPLFLVHYKGWKSRHDEWVDYDRILEINPQNLAKMAELKRIYSTAKKVNTPVKTKKKNDVKKLKPQKEHEGRHLRSNSTITTFKVKYKDGSNVGINDKKANNLNKRVSVRKNRTKQIFIKEEPNQPNTVALKIEKDSIVPVNIGKLKRHNLSENSVKEEDAPLKRTPKRINSKIYQKNPVIIDTIDLTKDEEEKNGQNPLVFNIFISRGSALPVINIQKDDDIEIL